MRRLFFVEDPERVSASACRAAGPPLRQGAGAVILRAAAVGNHRSMADLAGVRIPHRHSERSTSVVPGRKSTWRGPIAGGTGAGECHRPSHSHAKG